MISVGRQNWNSLMVDDREALSGNPAGNQPDNG
jgi:hypothetical protein